MEKINYRDIFHSLKRIHKTYEFEPFEEESYKILAKQDSYEGRFSNSSEIQWLVDLGLLCHINDNLSLNGEAKELINTLKYDTYNNFKESLFSYICDHPDTTFFQETSKLLERFHPIKGGLRLKFDKKGFDAIEYSIIELLYAFRIISIIGKNYLIHIEDISKVQIFLARGRGVSVQELKRVQDYKEEIGLAAELKCVEYEKERLRNMGLVHLAENILHVGQMDIMKGYDIHSYTGLKDDFEYDKKIEVKGTTHKDEGFYWSRNEIKVAKESKDQYWLFVITDFNPKYIDSGEIHEYQNPYETVYVNPAFDKSEELIYVKRSKT